jgi:hypothetical protein
VVIPFVEGFKQTYIYWGGGYWKFRVGFRYSHFGSHLLNPSDCHKVSISELMQFIRCRRLLADEIRDGDEQLVVTDYAERADGRPYPYIVACSLLWLETFIRIFLPTCQLLWQ